jgi:hypothetical protein
MALFKATFDTFSGADGFLGERKAAKIGHNTTVERRGTDQIAVRYHFTDVVTYNRDGSVEVNNGGWPTNTTRERIRTFSPVNVYQRDSREYWADGRPFTGHLVLSPAVIKTLDAGRAL